MNYAKAVRICRAAAGLRQCDVAERAGVTPSHLSLIESGKRNPSLETLRRIAKACGVPFGVLCLLSYNGADLSVLGDLEGHARVAVEALVRAGS